MQEIAVSLFEVKKEELFTLSHEKQILIYNPVLEKYHLTTVSAVLVGDLPKTFKTTMIKDQNFYFLFDK